MVALPGEGAGVLSRPEPHALNIGGEVFRRFTVVFDYRRSRVSLVPNSRVNDPFEAGMTGLGLTTLGPPYDRIVVDFVVPASAGADAGVRAGDRILAIDGEPVTGLSLTDVKGRFKAPEGTRFVIVVERQTQRITLMLTTKRIV